MIRKFIRKVKHIIPAPFLNFIFYNFPFIANKLSILYWKSMISVGDIVIQGGADMGWKQEKFSASNVFKILKIIGDTGKLFVIEPDIKNYELLINYVEKNNIKNIIAINKAIWSKQTKLKFMIGKRSNDSQLSEYLKDVPIQIDKYWTSEYEIDTITLDRLHQDY